MISMTQTTFEVGSTVRLSAHSFSARYRVLAIQAGERGNHYQLESRTGLRVWVWEHQLVAA